MTIRELREVIKRIEELEEQLEIVKKNPDAFYDSASRIKEIENLISIYSSEEIE